MTFFRFFVVKQRKIQGILKNSIPSKFYDYLMTNKVRHEVNDEDINIRKTNE